MNQNNTDKVRYISWIFLPTIIAILIQSAVSIMGLELFVVNGMASYSGGDYTNFVVQVMNDYSNSDIVAWSSVAYAIIAAVIAFYIFKKLFREGKLSGIADKTSNIWLTIAGMLMFTLGMQYVTTYLLNAFASAFPSWLEEYNALLDAAGIDTEMTFAMVIYTIVFGPICEELLFRGITFFAAKKVMPVYYAIVVQAIMFGSFHMNKLQGLYAFVLALGLGYIMYLYDNLVITIIIHVLFNLLGTIGADFLPMFGDDNLISFFFCCLASLVITYFALVLLKRCAVGVNNEGDSVDI